MNNGKRTASELRPLIAEAKRLCSVDMDRYWLFCYEVLTVGLLPGEWKDMKSSKVSFLK